jgi:predicted acetylornithine/succinylornithine family transaminase
VTPPLEELQTLERENVIGTYARQPVEFVRGSGTRLWDADGNEYLDFLAGISVVQIGHSHPRWVEAVCDQAGRLAHVGNLFYTEPVMRLAERLASCSLSGKVFFSNSGAEAIECALKLARKHRGGGDFVVVRDGFHGRTYGALSATPQEAKQAPFAPLVPGFKVVPRDDPDALAAAVDSNTAAVLLEPIQGESGIHPLDDAVLHAARAACDSAGALLIFDEIQCGMGRTGTMWAWEGVGVRPDVMSVAKGLGGGLPIGACVTAPEYADVLGPGDHGSTFAGGPIPCAGALAVLDVVGADGFLDDVRAKGDRLLRGLDSLSGGRARGRGLMTAITVEDGPGLVRRALLEERLVLNATGPDSVRLLPPLTVSEDEIDDALLRLGRLVGSPA